MAEIFILQKGLAKFGEEGVTAAKKEVSHMHHHVCFKVLAVNQLTQQGRRRAMEGLMFLSHKNSGEVKDRLAYNGKPTRQWVDREEKSSPTAFTESILLLAGIDAAEERDVMVLDISNAFSKTPMPPTDEKVAMKIKGKLVNWSLEIYFMANNNYVVYEKGVKTLYLLLHKAIYGMLTASLLWYQKFHSDLEQTGFRFNDFDSCIANREVDGSQHTIRYHVDDVISSHLNSKVNDDFAKWANQVYGKLKRVEVHRGEYHEYLGMRMDFQKSPGRVHVSQHLHVKDFLESWPEKLEKSGITKTPAPAKIFVKGGGGLLCQER